MPYHVDQKALDEALASLTESLKEPNPVYPDLPEAPPIPVEDDDVVAIIGVTKPE